MELSDDVAWRVVNELKSYVPFVLPMLLIYTAESNASLKLWHAVRQLPHLEKDSAPDDEESRISVEQVYKARATREAVKKEARRIRIHQFVFSFVLAVIALFDQFVIIYGWLNRSRDGDDFDGYVGSGVGEEAEFDGQSGYGYGWYYDSIIGQIDWTKSYYTITLFIPVVCMLSRTICLISGLNDRVVLRDTKGVPFMVVAKGDWCAPRRPPWLAVSIIAISAFCSIQATWYHNPFFVSVVFASMIHFVVSNPCIAKVVAFKWMALIAFCMLCILASLVSQLFMIGGSFPIRFFAPAQDTGNVNWSGLIFSALVCTGPFSHMAMISYRMDHSFARPDELLTGTPDVSISRASYDGEDVEMRGTRITYLSRCFRRRSSPTASGRSPRWPKPYFHASILSWLFTYVVIAAAAVLGYIDCEAEMAGVYALYISPANMCLGVLLCALARGEVKRVWAYKEDWAGEPVLDTRNGEAGSELAKVDEEKVLIEVE